MTENLHWLEFLIDFIVGYGLIGVIVYMGMLSHEKRKLKSVQEKIGLLETMLFWGFFLGYWVEDSEKPSGNYERSSAIHRRFHRKKDRS